MSSDSPPNTTNMSTEPPPISSSNVTWYSMANDTLDITQQPRQFMPYNIYDFDVWERVSTLLSQPHHIVALILGFLAIALNILSILAIVKTRRGLTAHYRFIISLALSDILIGMSVTLHIINRIVNPAFQVGYGPWGKRIVARCFYMFFKAMNTTSLNITLLNLMGMAIDHFLAILRPLHYPTLMDKSRATVLIVSFWILAIICGFSDFLSGYPKYYKYTKRYNYCEFIYLTKYQDEYPMFAIAILCLFVMTFTYVCMFLAIRGRHQNVGPVRQEVQRNKKALLTTLLILGTFILCWLPMCLFQIILIIKVKLDVNSVQHLLKVFLQADRYLYDLLLLNAIFDPIIYAVRMREVQYGYRRLAMICCPHFKKETTRLNRDDTTQSMLADSTRSYQMSLRSNVVLDRTLSA